MIKIVPTKQSGIGPGKLSYLANLLQFFFFLSLSKACCLSGPPRVSQSGVELEKFFECDFMASDDAYGSYKTYGKVRLKFGPL